MSKNRTKYIFDPYNSGDNIREVLDKLIGGIDICFVDPRLYSQLSSWIDNYRERYKSPEFHKVIEKLDFFENYISGFERREAIQDILTPKAEKPQKKPPPLSEDEIRKEVDSILIKNVFRDYPEKEMVLIVAGLRKRRFELEEEGKYLEAEKADEFAKRLINHEQLCSVESMQMNKIDVIQSQIDEEISKLEVSKTKWEELNRSLRSNANQELKDMRIQHNNEIEQLLTMKENDPPPAFNKFSPELLQLRRREQAMVRSRKFGDAGKYKELADEMEIRENENNIQRWKDDIDAKIHNLSIAQKRQLEGRKLYWKNVEIEMVNQANKEIENTQRAISHMRHNLKMTKEAMNLASSLKEGTKRASSPKLPALGENANEIERVRTATHGQRRILNKKIYTRKIKSSFGSPRHK